MGEEKFKTNKLDIGSMNFGKFFRFRFTLNKSLKKLKAAKACEEKTFTTKLPRELEIEKLLVLLQILFVYFYASTNSLRALETFHRFLFAR